MSAVVNIALDLILILGFVLGGEGAAIATDASQLVSCVMAIIYMMRVNADYKLFIRQIKVHRDMAIRIIKIGLPTAIGGSTMQFGFLLMTKNVNVYGATAMTSYGIGNKINSIITMPANGIGSAISTIVG